MPNWVRREFKWLTFASIVELEVMQRKVFPAPCFFLFLGMENVCDRCYVVSLQGKRRSDSDREYDAGRAHYLLKITRKIISSKLFLFFFQINPKIVYTFYFSYPTQESKWFLFLGNFDKYKNLEFQEQL